ncbi:MULTISPECIES: hypothetical protein [unclassified Streptomyces]|uniref:hypothetical protein n=1 Tax=Streptomyces sp. NPDC055082 TaxID=3365718 RepID=UPI0037CED007
MTVLRKGYAYQWRHRVHGHLEEQGVRVVDCSDPRGIREHAARARRMNLRRLVLDYGGFVSPLLLDQIREGYSPASDEVGDWAGAVEQTMSGIYRLQGRGAELPYPVFAVAQSRLKARIESYWITEKAVHPVEWMASAHLCTWLVCTHRRSLWSEVRSCGRLRLPGDAACAALARTLDLPGHPSRVGCAPRKWSYG